MSQFYAGLAAMKTNINLYLQEREIQHPWAKSRLGRLCEKILYKDAEQLKLLGYAPKLQEKTRDIQAHKIAEYAGPSIALKTWSVQMAVKLKDLERPDYLSGMYRERINEMIMGIDTQPYERLINTFLENGTGTTYGTPGFDGLALFHNTHYWPRSQDYLQNSTTFDNSLTENIADPTAPTVAEMKKRITLARAQFASFKNDRGGKIYPGGTHKSNLVAIFPTNHDVVMEEIGNSLTLPATTSGGDVTNVLKGWAELWSEGILANTDRWYLFNLSGPKKPFLYFYDLSGGKEWKIWNTDPDGDQAKQTGEVIFGVDGDYEIAYGAWFKALVDILT